MCLTMEFFAERDRVKSKYLKDGYRDLDDLDISEEELRRAGLIEEVKYYNTAMYYTFQLTRVGKMFFKKGPYQLILLKPNAYKKLRLLMENKPIESEKKLIILMLSVSALLAALIIYVYVIK